MWIAKGTLLGLWLFSFGTIAWLLYFQGYRPAPGVSFDIRSLAFITVSNPSWWLWLVACLSLGMIAARNWPGRGVAGSAVWIGLAITELVPLGLLAGILVLVNRLRAMR